MLFHRQLGLHTELYFRVVSYVTAKGDLQNLNCVCPNSTGGINEVLQQLLTLSGTVSVEAQQLTASVRSICNVSHLLAFTRLFASLGPIKAGCDK